MNAFSAFLFRFRGYILGLFAVGVLLCPAYPLFGEAPCVQVLYLCGVLALYALGIFLRVKARMHIGAHSRGRKHDADTLVTSGVYAYMRHPLYCSNSLVIFGVVLLHLGLAPAALLWILVGSLFELALARIEDRFLESRFGEEWRAWASRTGVIPSFGSFFGKVAKEKRALSRRVPPKRTFMQAFCADSSTWVWLLIINFLVVLLKFCEQGKIG